MKITMTLSSISRNAGGLFDIGRYLSFALRRIPATEVRIVGVRDEFTSADAELWSPVEVFSCSPFGPRRLGWSPSQQDALSNSGPDIVHQHGIWGLSSLELLRYAKRTKVPYVASVHGMVDPWALRRSRWKKRIAWLGYQQRALAGASCIFVNSHAEAEYIRKLGLANPIAVLPNGVNPPPEIQAPAPWLASVESNRRVLLFLGRLHPKKGLFELLPAWSNAIKTSATNWTLVIAGWDDGGHEKKLREMAGNLGIPPQTLHFAGPLFGADRDAAMHHAHAFILPSFSEGMPMAVLEAMSHCCPLLITEQCNLSTAFTNEAAIRIDPNVESIRAGLLSMFALSDEQREQIGARGRQLVEEVFSWDRVAANTRQVYSWLLGQGDRPEYVLLPH